MLMTPILGVGKVTNVVPADGASDAETLDDMRTAAPQSIRTLDRVVSLGDFEAFARARAAAWARALATELHRRHALGGLPDHRHHRRSRRRRRARTSSNRCATR